MAVQEKVLLAGFSGAGKSSLLRELEASAPPGWNSFEDLDQLVLKIHRFKDVAALISEVGWEKFRLWERQALETWIKEEGKGILSLGGGALSPLVWELYRTSRKLQFCHLRSDFEDCWRRLQRDGEERPLVKLGKIELHKIYNERMQVFNQIEWQIQNDGIHPLSEVAQEIWNRLSKVDP